LIANASFQFSGHFVEKYTGNSIAINGELRRASLKSIIYNPKAYRMMNFGLLPQAAKHVVEHGPTCPAVIGSVIRAGYINRI
jgi:hypothetical protein